MYYGAALFTSINPSFCSWVLLFLKFYDLETSVEPYSGVLRPTAKLIKRVKIAHSFLQPVSNQFHVIILSLPM